MINGKIIDTSVWIDYFNGKIDERTNATVKFIVEGQILMLPIILQEVLQGIKSSKDFAFVKNAFLRNTFVDYDAIEMALEAATLFRFLRRNGISIRKPNDSLIAAICIRNNFSLIHNDKDFDNMAKHTTLKIYK